MLKRALPSRSSSRAATAACSSCVSSVVETLERRVFFTVTPDPGSDFAHAFNVGDLNGQVTLGDAVGAADNADVYKFTMPRDGVFFGRLRANNAPAEIDLIQEQVDSNGQVHDVLVDFRIANQDGPDAGFASGDLPQEFLTAGNYFMFVSALSGQDTSYLVRMTADYAGDTPASARNIGSLTDQTFQDFIGQFPSPSLQDPVDTYKFKMDAPGAFNLDFSLDSTDANTFKAHVELIHDINNNNVIDPGELFIVTASGTASQIRTGLGAGNYIARVVSDLNFSNYHLHLNADYANPDNVRDMGSLDKIKSFNDFISSSGDTFDDYKFSVNAIRPLFASVSEDFNSGGTNMLGLYLDENHNGVAENDELLISTAPNRFNTILTTLDPGQYILRVTGVAGGGTYEIAAETRPDQAGDFPRAAKNLGTVNGLVHLDDYLSGETDGDDVYKFKLAAPGTIGAAIFTEFGGDADLALVRDTNGDGFVEPNEILATAKPTVSGDKEFIKSSLPAGVYYLRVEISRGSLIAKYFVSFHTDYAGSTTGTARNVGTLNGSVGFDDWASGPFGGAISDTNDTYKLTLAAMKKLTAKLTGKTSGQDLKLILYRDKNNDGKLTNDEIITISDAPNSPNEQFSKTLAAGTYYVRVFGVNGETNYHLSLTAS
jgi:hypothetical protein